MTTRRQIFILVMLLFLGLAVIGGLVVMAAGLPLYFLAGRRR